MYKLVKPSRVAALLIIFVIIILVYLVFLYKLQIIEGERYYHRNEELIKETKTVTAARGNILDRYGRILVSNKEAYNIKIDITKLFASEDPNSVILDLVDMVRGYGDDYTDDLPITLTPPFEYDPNMTEIQSTMLKAYFRDKGDNLPENPTAVELMAYMRTRYDIDNSYSAEQMRLIAGVRYSINVRYAINTADYVFVQDASMGLISSIMENKLTGIEVSRAYVRHYNTQYAAHLLGYVGLMTKEEYEKYNLLEFMSGKTALNMPLKQNSMERTAKLRRRVTSPGQSFPRSISKSRNRAIIFTLQLTVFFRNRRNVSWPMVSPICGETVQQNVQKVLPEVIIIRI